MRELRLLIGRTVVVATAATTVRGVVVSVSRQFVRLEQAESVDGPEPVKLAGWIVVPVAELSYVQVMP